MEQYSSIMFTEPDFNYQPSAWIEHIPFAFFLIERLKPKTFVELGTQYGNSYFAFCQAINDLKLHTKAYAVDVWPSHNPAFYNGRKVFEYANKINLKHFSYF